MDDTQFTRLIELARSMVMDDICPWTNQQDSESLLNHIRQECDELSEAINEQMPTTEIASEAGDVLMLVLVLCFKLENMKIVSVNAIIDEIITKIRRRAPHVFDPTIKLSLEEAEAKWSLAKRQEKQKS